MKAPIPKDEAKRLEALYAYGLLDTDPEADFDELAVLASKICECPIASVTLVDRARQWFKAAVGASVRETDRDVAFCAHAILSPDKLMVVSDATQDPRFAGNPLVLGDPRIRFYAGAPLLSASGAAIGTICVVDTKPRELTEDQATALTVFARQVSRLFELRRVSAELARALGEVKILEGLLPICCHCKSMRDEGGAWQPLETYMMNRTKAQFTHGICPHCAKVLYPDLDLSSPSSRA